MMLQYMYTLMDKYLQYSQLSIIGCNDGEKGHR
jgi:hypothetical protein